MKPKFNDKTNTIEAILEEKDFKDAQEISLMMKTKGWKILQDYLEVLRESLIDAGKGGINTRAKRDLSDIKLAILKGFDDCRHLPENIVARAENDLKRRENKEEPNAPTNEYGE